MGYTFTDSRSWGQVFPACSLGDISELSALPEPSRVPRLHCNASTFSHASKAPRPDAVSMRLAMTETFLESINWGQ